jgi:regulator of sigma E protease
MQTLISFLVMLSVIVVVHEYGHYKVAVLCGVRVLKFSIGFGAPLLGWQLRPFTWIKASQIKALDSPYQVLATGIDSSKTLFLISSIPLGGYVKMLDEREDKSLVLLDPDHLAGSFNRKSSLARALIVIAGPMANLVLAVILYACVQWVGQSLPAAVLGAPTMNSVLDQSGFISGDRVSQISYSAQIDESQPPLVVPIRTYSELREALIAAKLAFQSKDDRTHTTLSQDDFTSNNGPQWVELSVFRDGRDNLRTQETLIAKDESNLSLKFDISEWAVNQQFNENPKSLVEALKTLGLTGPKRAALIDSVLVGGVAEKAGLKSGDLVMQVNKVPVQDAQQLIQLIRNSSNIDSKTVQTFGLKADQDEMVFKIERKSEKGLDSNSPVSEKRLYLRPKVVREGDKTIGRVDAIIGGSPELVFLRLGFWDGLRVACSKTFDQALMSVSSIGRMLIGQLSWHELSGPLTMAEFAGKSAEVGLASFLNFLAFVSVSVGVLNLLPIPVLDGGQLMYYLWEFATGKGPSEIWQSRFLRFGLALLILMMSTAFFNDVMRLIG